MLDKSRQILIKNLKNEVTKKLSPPHATTDLIFYAGTGMLLCRSEDKMTLFDLQQKRAMGEMTCPGVKYVVWAHDMRHVAFISKHVVVLARRDAQKLEQICTVHETIRIKSGAWEGDTCFLYTTLNHIKYCLLSGDSGLIRTLDAPVYLCKASGNKVFCLDREGTMKTLSIDNTECLFKTALVERKYDEVLKIIKRSKLCGQSIIGYLQKKGFPEVALHFVKDEKTRFNLAIECGNIEVALASATALDDKDCWHKLGVEALKQGNHQIVEMAYQKTKDFERLSFLYLITGNIDKLSKMLKIAEMRGDIMGRFHNALYLGDALERAKILKEIQQPALAYITAKTHGLTELAEELGAILEATGIREKVETSILDPSKAGLLFPPTPIFRESNWPLLRVSKGYFDGGGEQKVETVAAAPLDADIGGGWGDDDLDLGDGAKEEDAGLGGKFGDEEEADGVGGGGEGGAGWDIDDDLDLGDLGTQTASKSAPTSSGGAGFFAPPTMGVPALQRWQQASSVPGEHMAAGSFETAMDLLRRQCGIMDFATLKPLFLSVYLGAQALISSTPGAPLIESALHRNAVDVSWTARGTGGLPAVCITLANLSERIKLGYKAFTDGKLPEAQSAFVFVLQAVLAAVVDSKQDLEELRELMGICREYITAVLLETTRRDQFKDDAQRNVELAAYLTHCNLQPLHLLISLRSAMSSAVKLKNFNNAASFARRLLELNPKAEHKEQALKVLKVCDANRSNSVQLDYDERNPFVVCTQSYKPIFRGQPISRCGFCHAPFAPQYKGSKCNVCGVGEIGFSGTGLQNSRQQRERGAAFAADYD